MFCCADIEIGEPIESVPNPCAVSEFVASIPTLLMMLFDRLRFPTWVLVAGEMGAIKLVLMLPERLPTKVPLKLALLIVLVPMLMGLVMLMLEVVIEMVGKE